MTTRRTAIKRLGLGAGGTLLTPFVRQLAAAEGATPQRFVFVIEGNGVPPEQIQPLGIARETDGSGRNAGSDLHDLSLDGKELPQSLEPLEPLRDRLTIIQGLSGRICGGGHSNNFGTLGAYPGKAGAFGQTIDMALAEALPAVFPQVGLGISARPGDTTIYNCSAKARGERVPTLCRPDIAYQQLFGSVAAGDTRETFDADSNLLDFMSGEVRRLERHLDGDEREKLSQYLGAFEALSERQTHLRDLRPELAKHAPSPAEKFRSRIETDRLEAHFDLGAAALTSGLTNVLTIASGVGDAYFNVKFEGLGIPISKHAIGHAGNYGNLSWEQMMVKIRRYHMGLIANLATRLQSTPEGNGTMLDNTLIIYLSDAAESHHSRCWEWPLVLLGGLGGRLRAGSRYLCYPKYGDLGHRTIANLYTTLLHAAGAPKDRFGLADPNLRDIDQDGPLQELLR